MKTTITITKTVTVTSTTRWIDKAKEKHGLSDYALAPHLGIGRGQMSRYRNGLDFLSDDAAIKLAALLEMDDPAPIIASAHAERAKTKEAKVFWERLAGVAATLCLAVGVVSVPSPAEARTASPASQNAGSGMYIM